MPSGMEGNVRNGQCFAVFKVGWKGTKFGTTGLRHHLGGTPNNRDCWGGLSSRKFGTTGLRHHLGGTTNNTDCWGGLSSRKFGTTGLRHHLGGTPNNRDCWGVFYRNNFYSSITKVIEELVPSFCLCKLLGHYAAECWSEETAVDWPLSHPPDNQIHVIRIKATMPKYYSICVKMCVTTSTIEDRRKEEDVSFVHWTLSLAAEFPEVVVSRQTMISTPLDVQTHHIHPVPVHVPVEQAQQLEA
uniref:(California timema) hypothetical protein n=1 Tax=Timema californicum TaxID=61474 RepID=A0A7R9P945_TIMCA|nr:unnamed protein product [Timema californicum]